MPRPIPLPRLLAYPVVGLALGLGLLGCGAGNRPAGVDDASATALHIATARLPAARVEVAYTPTQLTAVGASAPVTWTVVEGRLPRGIDLSPGGILRGAAREEGIYEFTVAATDGEASDETDFALAVDTFGLTVNGLRFGDAWTGEGVRLVAVGASGGVTFSVTTNESGGAFDRIEEEAATAVYVPGPSASTCLDTVRAFDQATGAEAFVTLEVMPHPASGHRAAFVGTDVWYVDFRRRLGLHGFPSDWAATLHALGLRSASRTPTEADDLADFYVRRQVLRNLNLFFGREADGSQGHGLPISFPIERPAPPHEAPAAGAWATPRPGAYNVMAVCQGSTPGVVGLALHDSPANELLEHDAPSISIGALGVFVNQIGTTFNAAWQNEALPADPVGLGDVATLRAMIYDRPSTESERATRIRRMADDFAYAVAMVVAHEIGHSLGLDHNTFVTGSIMNNGSTIYPGARYRFLEEDRARLARALPGPGRIHAPAASGAAVPEGGISAARVGE